LLKNKKNLTCPISSSFSSLSSSLLSFSSLSSSLLSFSSSLQATLAPPKIILCYFYVNNDSINNFSLEKFFSKVFKVAKQINC